MKIFGLITKCCYSNVNTPCWGRQDGKLIGDLHFLHVTRIAPIRINVQICYEWPMFLKKSLNVIFNDFSPTIFNFHSV
eukprot:UN03121